MNDRPEVEMSDVANETQEPVTITVADLVASIEGGDALNSGKQFDALLQSKIGDALDAERIKVAGQVFNGDEADPSDEEVEAAIDEVDAELEETEAEVEETEAEVEVEEPVAEVEVEETEEEEEEVAVEEPTLDLGDEEEHSEPEDTLGLYGDEVESVLSDEEENEEVAIEDESEV